jgi:hypothetical protein
MSPMRCRAFNRGMPGRRTFRSANQRGRIFTAGLCAAAVAIVLAGCSNDEPESGRSTTSTTPSTDVTTSTAADPSAGAGTPVGDVGEVEPTPPPAGLAASVALDQRAEFGNGVTARITSIEPIDAQSSLPGEISGPAVQFTIEVTNGTPAEINMDAVTVDLRDAAGLPAYQITTAPAEPFSGSVAPGDSTTGRYVFTLAPENRSNAFLTINYSADTPTVVLTGDLPNE